MRLRKLQIFFVLFTMGCDSREPMGNSTRTSLLLDTFVNGARFGVSFDSISRYGTIVEQDVDSSGSTLNISLASHVAGFSGLRVLGQSGGEGATGSVNVYRFIFYSSPESAAVAATMAETRARTIFGRPGQRGCTGYEPHLSNPVLIWEEQSGGGVVLSLARRDPPLADLAMTRLTVFPPGVYAKDAVANLKMAAC
jgi:hypothetical protein